MKFRIILPIVAALLGSAVLTPITSFSEETLLTESIAFDSIHTAEDIRTLTDYLHGRIELTPEVFQSVDMNGDGEVDVFDLGLLKRDVLQDTTGSSKLTPTVQKDVTEAVEPLLWNNVCLPADAFASVQTFVISTPEELQDAMKGLQEAVQRSMQNTYNEAFFKDNVLILHYGYQNFDSYETEIEDISYQDDILTVTAVQNPVESYTKKGIEIWQITVPRSQYNGNNVRWVAKDTEYLNAGYDSFAMWSSGFGAKENFTQALGKDGLVVRDFAALKDLSETLFEDKGAQMLQKKYSESFFEKKALWFSYTTDVLSTYSMWQARKVGDTVYADIRSSESFGDIADYYLHILSFDKDVDAKHFKLHKITLPTYPGLSGRTAFFDGVNYDTALLVNTYDFGNEHEIAFYWAHTIGNVPYAAREKIASYAVSEDCSDFNQPSEELSVIRTETMLDDTRVWKNDEEQYAIVMGPDEVTIRFLKSKASEEEVNFTIPYPEKTY